MCVSMFAHVWVYVVCVCACGGVRMICGVVLDGSSTLFIGTGSFNQTQNSPIWLVFLANLLWGSPVSTVQG